MTYEELKLNISKFDLNNIKEILKYEENINISKSLEEEMCESDFYDREDYKEIINRLNICKKSLNQFEEIKTAVDDILVYLELYTLDLDLKNVKEAEDLYSKLLELKKKVEISILLNDKYDNLDAIITIHPGAGGTESQDWAEMLFRMYQKWANKSGYEIMLLDLEMAIDAGIKNVSFLVKGDNPYGYLKSENGVHRLVRISPFDSGKRRHTSFASVEVMPDIDTSINVEINDDDLQIDTYRASGAGGQHVNKTDSAIRIKHVPTNIVVTCQTERSQLQNKENAMKMLKAKLYRYLEIKNKEKISGIKGESLEIAWGSQIRSYVFCPYTLVKDHRTNYEIGNVNAVMDGKIDEFMYEYLKSNKK